MNNYSIMSKMNYVKKINSQQSLKIIALKDTDWHVREVAVKKLTDEETIKTVALNDDDWNVRKL